jgi:hypothetical protein
MELAIGITSVLSVLIGVGFIIFLYLKYLKNQKDRNPHYQSEKENFEYSDCPDFFETITDSNGNKKCNNVYSLGSCRTKDSNFTTVSFDDNLFNNTKDGNYWKCRWAKDCNVPWDGIDRLC